MFYQTWFITNRQWMWGRIQLRPAQVPAALDGAGSWQKHQEWCSWIYCTWHSWRLFPSHCILCLKKAIRRHSCEWTNFCYCYTCTDLHLILGNWSGRCWWWHSCQAFIRGFVFCWKVWNSLSNFVFMNIVDEKD